MSKINNKKTDMESSVMQKIKKSNIKMKPRWFFVVGSGIAFAGLIASAVTSIFLVNLAVFLVKKQGLGVGKLNMMLTNFPLWVPVVAVLGIVAGIFLLHKYDFSYKKNFLLIIIIFIVSIFIAGLAIDMLGLNDVLMRNGSMRNFYQKYSRQGTFQIHQPQPIRRGVRN